LSLKCRLCRGESLEIVLSLGTSPLANSLLRKDKLSEDEPTFPLDLAFCHECSLVQLTESVDPQLLFSDYLYFSSFSDTVLDHSQKLAQHLIASRSLDAKSLVVEVGSNDGYLLQFYRGGGIPVLGIDPAANIAQVAEQRGVRTAVGFFGLEMARQLRAKYGCADVIHANNVLAHVPDPNTLMAGFAELLKPNGIVSVEVPSVKELVDRVEFDTIYHEHFSYYSLTTVQKLALAHGLQVVNTERLTVHGGSLRITLGREGMLSAAVQETLDDERRQGVDTIAYYTDFGRKVEGVRTSLVAMLGLLKAAGNRVAAYGASAKGATLLNYCGVGRETLDFVVDRSTAKQGYYTPGSHLPIYPPERLVQDAPEYTLLLTWNFADEIFEQQQEYRRAGGRFLIPVPMPTIL
jgi:SAM-dependent methyltransferase